MTLDAGLDDSLDTAAAALPQRRSLALNSAGLVAGKAAQMGTGYLLWLVAARTAPVHEVGVAAAAVSAVMLCTQVGLLGSGSAVIVLVGTARHRLADVVGAAVAILAVGSGVAAAVCLAIIATTSSDVGTMFGSAAFPWLFVLAAVFGTMVICLDQVSIALARGDQTLPRYLISGLAAVGFLTFAASGSATITAGVVFACWTVDAAISSLIGWRQTRHWLGCWVRPRFERQLTIELLRVGVPNQALTLAERAPALLVPVLTAQLVSPTVTATWYPAWMMAWLAYTAPVAVGLAQFSAIVRQPDRIRETTWNALRWSLLLGGAVAAVLIVAAEPVMSLLGEKYAASSAGALRLLALGIAPYAVLQAYNAACRARQRLGEATRVGVTIGVLACTTTVAAAAHGPTAMATAWLTVSTVAAGWCGWRLVRMTRGEGIRAP